MKFILPLRKPLSSPPPARRRIDSELEEDEAEFGGAFEDEFAVMRGAGRLVEGEELIGDGAAAMEEMGEASGDTLGREIAKLGLFRLAEEDADGGDDPGSIFGDEADGFAIDEEIIFAHGGFDGEVLLGSDADELGELEVRGAEAVEE